jgi:hypothetical protein
MNSIDILNARERMATFCFVVTVGLGRATAALWDGWWWPLTLTGAVYSAVCGATYLRAAWLGQRKTFGC